MHETTHRAPRIIQASDLSLPATSGWRRLPLIGIVFFTGYMAFESYARLREAQLSTLAGFIKALEAKDFETLTSIHHRRLALLEANRSIPLWRDASGGVSRS